MTTKSKISGILVDFRLNEQFDFAKILNFYFRTIGFGLATARSSQYCCALFKPSCSPCIFVLGIVRAGKAHVDSVHAGGRRDHDADLVSVHTEHAMLAVGGLLHCLHRTGRGRLHGTVERELGLDIHGESDHVHRVLRGLYRAHMLRVHVVEGDTARGTRPGEPVRAGPANHSGCG